MAGGWVKALQCKANAIEDVHHKPPLPSTPRKQSYPLLPLGCGHTSHHLKDIIILSKQLKPKPKSQSPPSQSIPRPKPMSPPSQSIPRRKPMSPNLSSFPTILPLPLTHCSRRVVELIFTSSWASPAPASAPTFPGEIEMLFKVHHPAPTFSRFEEYRDQVRRRAGAAFPRCAADGNEMMRFRPAPEILDSRLYVGPICDAGVVSPPGGEGAITTFSGSGGAHGGGGGKRRATLVCRVIAGRVWTGLDSKPNPVEYDSVSARKGELLVFDPRAVLPCFLIIYKI